MANLTDSIRLNTEVDLNGLINLIQEFKDLGIKVKDVAAASRALTEQMKRDALEQANSIKLVTLELISSAKIDEQIAKNKTANSNARASELKKESAEINKTANELIAYGKVDKQISENNAANHREATAEINKETAAVNKGTAERKQDTAEILKNTAAINQGTAERKQDTAEINKNTAAINQGTTATRQEIAEIQKQREFVKLAIDQKKLYNIELRNKALESDNAREATNKLNESIGSLTKVGTGFLAIFGIDTLGSFAQSMIDAQSKVQAFGLSMKNLIGNAYGEKLVNDLKQFTIETPLNFEDVIQSTNQLVGSFKAAGISSKTIGTEIPQILESIGNSAAALGGEDRMGRLVYAFSQVQATGRLMGTEVRQITETGFPMLAVLTQSLNERFPKLALSVSDVQKRVSDGKVSFEDFKIALLSAGQAGGVFAEGMEARMTTVAGSLDKLKESVFFALSNIGNQFNDIAKQAIDFGTSIVKSLFGTESAAQRTVDVVSNLTKIYLGYRAAVALVATGTAIKNAYDSASLVVQGLLMRSKALLNGESQKFITLMAEETLAKNINTGATVGTTAAVEVMTVAEAEAAIATRSLTAAFGVIAIVLGVAYAAYEIYKSTVEDTDAKQKELNDRMALGIAPIRESQSEFNRLANALKNSSDATQEKTTKLEALKAKFPEQLKGINDLATAEKLLGDKANDTNIVKDYRLKLFNELKTKFPEQTKGLKDVNYSETELSKIMKEVNGDFLIRQQLMKDEIALNMNKEKINIWLKEQIKLEGELATASTKSTYMVTGTAGNIKEIASERSEIEKAIAARGRWVLNAQETNAKIAENSIETTKKLKFNWEEQNKDANKAGKEQGDGADAAGKDKKEKTLKYQAETIMQGKILDEIAFRKELESSRENETTIRTLQKTYDDSRLKDAIATKKQRDAAQKELDHDFNNDMADLKRKWNAKEKTEAIKAEKEKNREIESEAKKSAERMWDEIVRRIEDKQKAEKKLAEDLKKLDEDSTKESKKLSEKQYELRDDLRILDRVSQAKSSKDLIKIESEEKQKILELSVKSYEQRLSLAKEHTLNMKANYGENSIEYKQSVKDMIIIQQEFTDASIDLAKFRTEKVKESIEKEAESFKKILSIVTDITDKMFDAVDKQTDERISKSTSAVQKNLLNNIKNETAMAKDGLSAIVSLASGDVAGAVTKGISLLFKAIDDAMNRSANHAKAVMQEQQEMITRYANKSKSEIENILTQISSLSDIYKPIQTVTLSLQEQSKLLDDYIGKLGQRGFSSISLINSEIAYGKEVQKNYETNVANEKDIFERKKQSIEGAYDNEVKRIRDTYQLQIEGINKKYDYEQLRANQKYNLETLSIVAAGSAQLEALIKNEESLSSVRAEFANKRLQIEQAFPLASKAITADMSEVEIDAINASIKARDEQLLKLQGWYNEELTFIVNSEDQKRKVYTATEAVQNIIRANLDLAAITFAGKEIEREKEKQQAIINATAARDAAELLALNIKNKQIEDATLLLNDNLVYLENQKNIALLDSFKRLQQGIEAEINRVGGLLSAINDKTSQEYKDLQEQLGALINKYKELVGVNPNITITDNTNIPLTQPRGFEKGTDDTSVALKGQRVVDNKGGWQAILHPQEAVFSKADMTQMETVFGKRPTRQEVIENFKIGVVNQVTPQMNPFVIQKMQANGVGNFDKLSGEIRSLAKEVSKKMSPVVYVDKGGIRTFYKNLNSQIEVKNQRFK